MIEAIVKELMEQCDATYTKVINESHLHEAHFKEEKTGNTHFKVIIHSDKFTNIPLIKRHRWVYSICDPFIKKGVHALAIETKTTSKLDNHHG